MDKYRTREKGGPSIEELCQRGRGRPMNNEQRR
jgi:hypothetical protein